MKNKHGVEMDDIPNCEDVGCLGCGGEDKTLCPCGNLSTHVACLDEGSMGGKTIYFRCEDCAHKRFASASVFYGAHQLPNYIITDEKVEKVRDMLKNKEARLG